MLPMLSPCCKFQSKNFPMLRNVDPKSFSMLPILPLAIKMLSWNGTHAFHALPCFEACCPLLPMLSHARKSRCISIPCFPCFTLRSDGEPKHGKHGNHGPTMVIPWFPCFVPCFFTRVLLQSKTLSRQLIVSYICQYHKFVYNSCSICLKSLSDSYSMVFH